MLAGSLTPPDKVNGEGHPQQVAAPQQHPHHALMPVMPALHTPPSPLPTPSPPVYDRFNGKEQRLTRDAMQRYLRERGDQTLVILHAKVSQIFIRKQNK